jgi:CheY-like chemotaxis protein
VQAFGGTITVRSAPGAGSTFRVSLPATTHAVADNQPPAPSTTEPTVAADRRVRVMLVEDDIQLGRSLTRLLAHDHDVVLVPGGPEALERIAAADLPFDVVICDLMMPGADGVDVYAALTEHHPEMSRKFALMTGGAFTAKGRAFLASGEVPVLDKPFESAQLRAMIDRLAST